MRTKDSRKSVTKLGVNRRSKDTKLGAVPRCSGSVLIHNLPNALTSDPMIQMIGISLRAIILFNTGDIIDIHLVATGCFMLYTNRTKHMKHSDDLQLKRDHS
jgi:hypothetical protein